jgi:hypothetical protein
MDYLKWIPFIATHYADVQTVLAGITDLAPVVSRLLAAAKDAGLLESKS